MTTEHGTRELWPKAVAIGFIVAVFASLWISTTDFDDAPETHTKHASVEHPK